METQNNGRGGKREGAGRKKLSESGRKQVQFSLQKDEIEMLKTKAKAKGLPMSRYIAKLIAED